MDPILNVVSVDSNDPNVVVLQSQDGVVTVTVQAPASSGLSQLLTPGPGARGPSTSSIVSARSSRASASRRGSTARRSDPVAPISTRTRSL